MADILNEQQLKLLEKLNNGELLPTPQEIYEQISEEVNKPRTSCLYMHNKEEV